MPILNPCAGPKSPSVNLFTDIMAAIGRLKQTLVRDAIRENVDVIEGRLPKGLRRWDRIRRAIFRRPFFVIVPLALFLSINALTTGKGERTDVVVVGTPAAPQAAAAPVLHAPKGLEPSLFRLAVRSVILDPGHGGSDPGAIGAGGVKEKDVTLDVATRVKAHPRGEPPRRLDDARRRHVALPEGPRPPREREEVRTSSSRST